jgi:selenocysteine lyase/cysteine desulfurase
VAIPAPVGTALHTALLARGIQATHNNGRLRITCHGYNTQAEIDAVLEGVDAGF